jgi:hypothetical protein
VLHHEPQFDSDPGTLGRAFRFLFSREPEQPPASPAMFAYCQPYRVAESEAQLPFAEGEAAILAAGAADEAITQICEAEDNVPAWLAATQRYVEQTRLDLAKAARGSDDPASRRVSQGHDTLRQIEQIIAQAARKSRTGSR